MAWADDVDRIIEALDDPGSDAWTASKRLLRHVQACPGTDVHRAAGAACLGVIEARKHVQALRRLGRIAPPSSIRLRRSIQVGHGRWAAQLERPTLHAIVETMTDLDRATTCTELAELLQMDIKAVRAGVNTLRKVQIVSASKGMVCT